MWWNWIPLASFAITGAYLAIALPYEVRIVPPVLSQVLGVGSGRFDTRADATLVFRLSRFPYFHISTCPAGEAFRGRRPDGCPVHRIQAEGPVQAHPLRLVNSKSSIRAQRRRTCIREATCVVSATGAPSDAVLRCGVSAVARIYPCTLFAITISPKPGKHDADCRYAASARVFGLTRLVK